MRPAGPEVADQAQLPAASRRRSAWLAGYRRQVVWMTVLTVLLLGTAAGTAAALVRGSASGNPAGSGATSQGTGLGVAAIARAAATKSAAAQWVDKNVSHSAIIGCDTVMCTALVKAGVASTNLLLLKPNAPDPLGAGVVVVTPALKAQFRHRLASEYAPSVLATFGSRSEQVAVRVVASYGAAAYQARLSRDIAARDVLGSQLIGNSQITLPAAARTDLASGQVDPRLLITLPALAFQHPVQVLGFYGRAHGASPGVPMTGVRLAGDDPQAGLKPAAYLRWMLAFLRGQRWVYRAATVTTASSHGQTVVSVRFALPNPIGLLH